MRKSVFLKSWYWDMLNRLNGDNVKAVIEALFDESKAGGGAEPFRGRCVRGYQA